MSMFTTVGGRKLPRSTRIAFLRSTSLGCSTSRSGPNIAAPLRPTCTSLSAISRLSTDAELDALELDHVDLDPAGGQPVEQALDEPLGLVVVEERAVQQVDADDAERLLLQRRLGVEHPHVQDDLAGLVARVRLELHAHPAVALVAAAVAARDHRVGEGEERGLVAALVAEPVQVELELAVQHRLQPAHRDVAVGLAVDGVADRHVVRRHRLGDRARPRRRPGRTSARPPGRRRSRRWCRTSGVEVDLQRLLQRAAPTSMAVPCRVIKSAASLAGDLVLPRVVSRRSRAAAGRAHGRPHPSLTVIHHRQIATGCLHAERSRRSHRTADGLTVQHVDAGVSAGREALGGRGMALRAPGCRRPRLPGVGERRTSSTQRESHRDCLRDHLQMTGSSGGRAENGDWRPPDGAAAHRSATVACRSTARTAMESGSDARRRRGP